MRHVRTNERIPEFRPGILSLFTDSNVAQPSGFVAVTRFRMAGSIKRSRVPVPLPTKNTNNPSLKSNFACNSQSQHCPTRSR